MHHIQDTLLRNIAITLLRFLYVTITLCRISFQKISSHEAGVDTSPITPHPYCITATVRFALFHVHSPFTNGMPIGFFSCG
jgi:hypothetical protein